MTTLADDGVITFCETLMIKVPQRQNTDQDIDFRHFLKPYF